MNEDDSKKKFTINKYHRSENCTELQEAFRGWLRKNNEGDKYNVNNIRDIETIFHTMMFYLIDNVRRKHIPLLAIENFIRQEIQGWKNEAMYWKDPWGIYSRLPKGYRNTPSIIENNIKVLIQDYISLYSSWVYDNIMIRNPYSDGEEEKRWVNDNKSWLADGKGNMWSYLLEQLFGDEPDDGKRKKKGDELPTYKLSFVLNWSLGDNHPIFFNLKKLENVNIEVVDQTKSWIIKKLINDYFITFMPTQISSEDTILNKIIWKRFYEWCTTKILNSFNITILLNDYQKGTNTGRKNDQNTNFKELNHVKLKF